MTTGGSRRDFLKATAGASMLGVAGCLNTPGNIPGYQEDGGEECLDDLAATAPEAEREVTSIDGFERNESAELVTREEAAYQCGPNGDMQCGNCAFYIADRTGNGYGACTEVEGEIRSVDWCGLWQPREKVPGGGGVSPE